MAEAPMRDAAARAALSGELAALHLRVAQPGDPPLFTRDPASSMQPIHWKAAELQRMMEKIGAHLKLEDGGQRRTLRLTNPGLPYGTTPTFWCSIQVILPGEIATAHRHTATALRFIMQGSGANTTVEGEQYAMNEGDLLLTPSWTWHDHEHCGDAPMVWLDVLDISLVRAMHATFFEPGAAPRMPVNQHAQGSFMRYGSALMRPLNSRPPGPSSPMLGYDRARAEEALANAATVETDPFDDTALMYQNPTSGGPALPTIGTVLQRLRPGFQGRAHRHTGSVVYYVVRGSGVSIVAGDEFRWGKGDFVAVPPWAAHLHSNPGPEEAVLFQVNDIPAMQALGLYREEAC
ncbi:MAG TPA: cupin domain-containing protein [Crenalkalicoccus sp.]|nr:cupin domain-containing protein [Crenalkalicoccus sp.]